MRFRTKYLNNNDELCDEKPRELNYGKRHLDLNNEVPDNSKFIKYKPISGSLFKNDLNSSNTLPQDIIIFINFIATMRRFFLSDRMIKRVLLLQKLAFKETGVAIETNKDIDTLFVYSFMNKFAQIEMYMSTCEAGIITELNYYNQMDALEIRIPLNFEGISYIFEQIFEDFYQFSMSNLNIEYATIKEKNLINSIMQFNTQKAEIDEIDIYEAIQGLIKTNSILNSHKIKQETDYILNNDPILEHINSKRNPIVMKVFDLIDLEISTPTVAKQFVLEALNIASKGSYKEKEFAEASGFMEVDYIDAMASINSFDEMNALRELMSVLEEYIVLKDRDKLSEIRIVIIDMMMKKYKLGKYEEPIIENIRYSLENQNSNDYVIDVYENYLVFINKSSHEQYKFEQVQPNKYYSKIHGYIEISKVTVDWSPKEKQNNQKFNIAKIEVISERNEFNHIYENERAKDFLYIMQYATEIETLLESKGATGKGMHTKITSIEYTLEKKMIKRLRRIATIRNKKMHRKGFDNYVFSNYEDDCKIVIDYLENLT